MVVLSEITNSRPIVVWIWINLVSSKHLRSVFILAVCSTPIEMQMYVVIVFMFPGDLTLLGTCPDANTTLLAFLGLIVWAARSWTTEIYSTWSMSYYIFINRVSLLLIWVMSGYS